MQEIMNNIIAATAFVGVFAGIIVEVIKRADLVSPRYLPALSIVIGMVTGFVMATGFNQDVAIYIAAGFIAGAAASGVYDLVSNLIGGNK
ncbi:holin [Atopococcus tabaci]|uniref:holin n=1 Tax=Atopococcus tabaci TaxID=269774 RepID=UPI00240A2C6E|nr:holin [Atopococcus tabaci]